MYIGKPAPPEEIVDRKDEVKRIVDMCTNEKINYAIALLGYRRIGKTTILAKAADELDSRGVLVVYFDVKKNLGDPAGFLNRLEKTVFDEYLRHMGKGKAALGTVKNVAERAFHSIAKSLKGVKGVGVQLTLKPKGDIELEPKLEFGRSPDYGEMFTAAFESINRVSKSIDGKVVVILDEFQDITKLRRYRGLGNILDRLRDVVQNRARNLTYVISGSQVHLTREFVERGTAMLHFVEVDVNGLKEPYAIELFEKYCGGRMLSRDKAKAGAEEAYRLVGGHPLYLMSLAEAWDGAGPLDGAYKELLTNPRKPLSLYAEYVLTADLAEAKRGEPVLRTVMRVLAAGPKSVSEVAKATNIEQAALPGYLKELIKYDLVTFDAGKYVVRDRIISDYLNFNNG
jgi:AAA+ ATPase superfamily predicted ATPase